jgi:hypothetical protein
VIHFVVDLLFGIPLFVAPGFTLGLLGWPVVDPIMTRIVAAALFGIGIESYLGRNAGVGSYKGMLNLKIIWSGAVILGIALSLVEGGQGRPFFVWIVLAIFLLFNGVWVYWRWYLAGEQD